MMMDARQAALQQQLIEQTQQLMARGGPAAVTTAGRIRLHYEPAESFLYGGYLESRTQGETYYPLAAVLAALSYPDLHILQEDWNEALGQRGPLPLYLCPTADGHYSAMIAESVVLQHLVSLTDDDTTVPRAD
jgi:hypothetical protein